MTEEILQQDTKRFCGCGCGREVKREFVRGHYNRLSTGQKNSHWKGGRKINSYGYIMILKPEHPYAQFDGYIFEHRLVMEQHLGRYMERNEVVHHKNGIKTDNRIENLQLFTSNGEHIAFELRNRKHR